MDDELFFEMRIEPDRVMYPHYAGANAAHVMIVRVRIGNETFRYEQHFPLDYFKSRMDQLFDEAKAALKKSKKAKVALQKALEEKPDG